MSKPIEARRTEVATDVDGSNSMLAALVAGVTGGILIGLLFGVVAAVESGSMTSLPIVVFSLFFGAGAGGVAALVPGTAVAVGLQHLGLTDLAPIVGAAIGALLGLFGYWLISLGVDGDFDELAVAYAGFGLSGLVGGLTGGMFLKHRIG